MNLCFDYCLILLWSSHRENMRMAYNSGREFKICVTRKLIF